MKKISMMCCALLAMGFASQAKAQLNDVTFIVSPTAQYTWWDNNLNLGNTPFWGFRAGFGFGPIVELRGVYEHSYNLKAKLKTANWNVLNNWANKLEDTKTDIQRIGGELKVNLWSNTLLTPYLTAGTGVIKFKSQPNNSGAKTYKEEQLYGSLGAGFKINFSRRIALSLEAKNTLFNVAKTNPFLNPDAKTDKPLQNWSAGASLDFYFGGNAYQSPDAISSAYRNLYSDGFNGIKFVVEPSAMYVDFNKNSNFNDQYFLGGSAGFDFTSILGIRGFYYQATQDPQKLNFKFNKDLKMYGGNIIARLNYPRGVTPYLELGGGYLNVNSDKYAAKDPLRGKVKSGYFAFGGAGIEIPLSRFVALYGNVDALINAQDNPAIKDVISPSEVNVSWMYKAGVRFNIGMPSANAHNLYSTRITDIRQANMDEINSLRASYDKRINELNNKLAEAALNKDTVTVNRILQERQSVEQESKEATSSSYIQPQGTIAITPTQFEDMVNKVVRDLKAQNKENQSNTTKNTTNMTDLDKILLLNALQHGKYQPSNVQNPSNETLLKKMDQMMDKMDQSLNNIMTANALNNQKVSQVAQAVANQAEAVTTEEMAQRAVKSNNVVVIDPNQTKETTSTASCEYATKSSGFFNKFNRMSILTGLSYAKGGYFNVNLGARAYMKISNTNFDFVPEMVFGFGSNKSFGLSGNVVYNFDMFKNLPIIPYAGIGLAYNSQLSSSFGTNVILGATLKNILKGNLFADYSLRGAFGQNVISVGYRFVF